MPQIVIETETPSVNGNSRWSEKPPSQASSAGRGETPSTAVVRTVLDYRGTASAKAFQAARAALGSALKPNSSGKSDDRLRSSIRLI